MGRLGRFGRSIGKIINIFGKVFTGRVKTRLAPTGFTFCLPGSQKVNAGGACGAWLPGRELLRISASTTASRETQSPSPADRDVICARTRKLFAGNI
jgi:hypothetical protein